MKHKIMILSNEHSWTYNLRKELIEKLLDEGYGVVLVLPYGERIDYFTALGCEFEDVPMFSGKGTNPIKDLSLLNAYRRLIKKHRPAAVISYTIKPNVYGGMACRMTHTPFIANITGLGAAVENGGAMQKLTTALYRIGLKKAHKVFFQNKANLDYMLGAKVVRDNYGILPGSGVNIDRFCVMDYPNSDTVDFIFVARIRREKGIDQYLGAAKAIREKYPFTRFHICGGCEESYEKLLADMNENGTVIYHGTVSDMKEIQKFSCCTIHPTFYPEGMSNVLLESCACGRPIITTDRPGCREIVEDGINGYMIKQRDTDSLIEAIEKFLSLSYEERKAMGLAGRAKMEREFDRTIVVNALLGEIEKIIKENQDKQ